MTCPRASDPCAAPTRTASRTSTRSSTTCSTARGSSSPACSAGAGRGPRASPRCARAARATAWRCCCSAARPSPTPSWPSSPARPRRPWPRPSSTCATAGSRTRPTCCASWPTRCCARATASSCPRALPDLGVYVPGRGDVALEEALAAHNPGRPTVGLVFYRSHRVTGNTAFVDALVAALDDAGADTLCVWAYSLRPDADGRVAALELLHGRIDALVTTVLASGGSTAADAAVDGHADWSTWRADALAALDVPVIQAVCATSSRAAWAASPARADPARCRDAGRHPRVRRAHRRTAGELQGAARGRVAGRHAGPALRARPRALRAPGRTGAGHARLRALAPDDARIAIVLSSFPTKHARIGNAVGLDTPASAMALLERLREAGYAVEHDFADGDELIHALIAAGGHDHDFLTDEQLAAATGRLPVAEYEAWFATLPAVAARGDDREVGPPAGRVVRRRRRPRALRPAARQRLRGHPAAARLRRESGGDLPRPRARARAPLPGRLPLAAHRLRRRRDRPPRQARHARVAAGQGPRPGARERPRRRARGRAALLPLRRRRPRRGRAGQAPRQRGDRRPPRPADDARRDLRRAGPARAAARRVRALRGARPAQAAGAGRAHLDPSARGRAAPRPRPGTRPSSRRSRISARSSSTSTATCARSRTSRSATGCTCSAPRPRASSSTACWRPSCAWGRASACPACGGRSAPPTASTSRRCSRTRAPWWSTCRRRCWRASPARRPAARTWSTDCRTRSAR